MRRKSGPADSHSERRKDRPLGDGLLNRQMVLQCLPEQAVATRPHDYASPDELGVVGLVECSAATSALGVQRAAHPSEDTSDQRRSDPTYPTGTALPFSTDRISVQLNDFK